MSSRTSGLELMAPAYTPLNQSSSDPTDDFPSRVSATGSPVVRARASRSACRPRRATSTPEMMAGRWASPSRAVMSSRHSSRVAGSGSRAPGRSVGSGGAGMSTMSRGTSRYTGLLSRRAIAKASAMMRGAVSGSSSSTASAVTSSITRSPVSNDFTLWCSSGSPSRSASPGDPAMTTTGTLSAQACAVGLTTFSPPTPQVTSTTPMPLRRA